MPRRSGIKWRKVDNQKIASIARRFNAKLTRTLRKNPEMSAYLPKRVSTKELKERIKTRQDFNRETKSLERFLRRGAEAPVYTARGVRTTKWEVQETRYKVQQINRRRTLLRRKANVSTEKGTMGTIQANNLNPKKFNINKIAASEWESFKKSVEKLSGSSYYEEKDELYKQNYLKALFNVFADQPDFPQLVWLVKQIPAATLVQMYYDEPILQIDFIYDPIEVAARMDAIIEYLANYLSR